MSVHELKVQPPYFDALLDGRKTFEVRRNDRAYQAGDVLLLREWHPYQGDNLHCRVPGCGEFGDPAHFASAVADPSRFPTVPRRVSFVYSGDPRFGGIEPGYVVLGLAPYTETPE